jgi:hypothetical protein
MLAYLALENIETVCMSTYQKSNSPSDMAVFYRHESEGRLQCEVKVYFSPAISDTAKTLGASPCEQPTRYDLNLLVGTPAVWSVLFPES